MLSAVLFDQQHKDQETLEKKTHRTTRVTLRNPGKKHAEIEYFARKGCLNKKYPAGVENRLPCCPMPQETERLSSVAESKTHALKASIEDISSAALS